MIPFNDVLIALQWLGAVYACSILGMLVFMRPGAYTFLRYGLGRVVGVVGLGAITWVLSLIKILPFTTLFIWLIIVALYAVVLATRRQTIKKCLKQHWRGYLFIEVVFLALFIIGIALRSAVPKIEGIEKMMDAAILSNLMRHDTGVPVDTWYAPNGLNYYYFGHWLVAMLAKMSRVGLAYAFNLGFAFVLATAGTSVFVLGWQIVKRKFAGFLALFLAFFASNLHPFIIIFSGQHNYFFFNSGRFVEQVINEYPLYSLILGDLHAHMMALVLSTAFYLAVALMYLDKTFKNSQIITALTAGGLVGLLSATNSFDVISCTIVFGLAVGVMRWRHKIDNHQTWQLAVAYILPLIIFTFIFMTHFMPAVGGVAIALFKTPLKHVFWQFGIPLILSFGALLVLWKKGWIKQHRRADLIWVFGLGGLIMIILPQLIFLKDIYYYQNPPFARANTVFKMWYSAWPLMAVATASLLVVLDALIKKKLWRYILRGVIVLSCILLAFGLYIGLKSLSDHKPNTLDGLAYLSYQDPTKLEIIKWVDKNITGQPIVLQAVGQSYSQKNWLASYSGLPTIIGWQSHEWGWRYSSEAWGLISQCSDSVQAIYESTDGTTLQSRASALNISYILIGPDELSAYKIKTNVFTETFGQPIFGNAKYALYQTSNTGNVAKVDIEQTPTYSVYIVKSGDTLWSISQKLQKDWHKIYDDNKNTIGNDPALIEPGQVLNLLN
jgi:uncharacterized membrane protein